MTISRMYEYTPTIVQIDHCFRLYNGARGSLKRIMQTMRMAITPSDMLVRRMNEAVAAGVVTAYTEANQERHGTEISTYTDVVCAPETLAHAIGKYLDPSICDLYPRCPRWFPKWIYTSIYPDTAHATSRLAWNIVAILSERMTYETELCILWGKDTVFVWITDGHLRMVREPSRR